MPCVPRCGIVEGWWPTGRRPARTASRHYVPLTDGGHGILLGRP